MMSRTMLIYIDKYIDKYTINCVLLGSSVPNTLDFLDPLQSTSAPVLMPLASPAQAVPTVPTPVSKQSSVSERGDLCDSICFWLYYY